MSAKDMLKELRDDNLKLVQAPREVKRVADETGDDATSGIVGDWTDKAGRRAWFLREAAA